MWKIASITRKNTVSFELCWIFPSRFHRPIARYDPARAYKQNRRCLRQKRTLRRPTLANGVSHDKRKPLWNGGEGMYKNKILQINEPRRWVYYQTLLENSLLVHQHTHTQQKKSSVLFFLSLSIYCGSYIYLWYVYSKKSRAISLDIKMQEAKGSSYRLCTASDEGGGHKLLFSGKIVFPIELNLWDE
jgi:hypothetical protein